MKKMITLIVVVVMVLAMLVTGCTVGGKGGSGTTSNVEESKDAAESASGESSLKGQNVRVVIGSTSTSGDSYMIAEIVTRYLSKEMGFNGKVDAIGNAAALDEITKAKGDGKTIMMFHDMTYLSVLFGAVGEEFALENLTVGPRIGQNPGGCFGALATKPYSSLAELTQYLVDNPDSEVTVNVEAGATSHLAFAAYYLHVVATEGQEVADRIRVIVGGTTQEKLQRMWDGNVDVIYGDTSAFMPYTEEGVEAQLKMNMFGSGDKVEGINIKSMADNGIEMQGKPFVFPKDFCMYFPKDMDEHVLKEIEAAMQKVTVNEDFIADMHKLFYNTLSPEEVTLEASKEFIYNKREISEKLIEGCPPLDDLT